MSNTIGLMARAKRLDNGEFVEGYSIGDIVILTSYTNDGYGAGTADQSLIDPQTLQYKLNDKWYSKAELEDIVKVKSCDICGEPSKSNEPYIACEACKLEMKIKKVWY